MYAMPGLGPISLEGTHVTLEPLLPEHAPALLSAASSGDELWSWMSLDLRDRTQLERWMNDAFSARDRAEEVPFTVRLRGTREIVGSTRFMDIREKFKGVEIGWTWYRRDVWGGPVNPEAKLLLMRHAFEMWGAIRVCLKTD